MKVLKCWCQLLIEQKVGDPELGYGGLAKFLNRTIEMLLQAQKQVIKKKEEEHQFGEREVLNMMTALGVDEENARNYIGGITRSNCIKNHPMA